MKLKSDEALSPTPNQGRFSMSLRAVPLASSVMPPTGYIAVHSQPTFKTDF